jgi:UDP-N-acetylmuramoyl-tripeptide--D-alanyl-D-alanine ligase
MTEKMVWNVRQALEATGGTLQYGSYDTAFSGISIDSRTTCQGDLFIAIIGASHDGHRHTEKGITLGQKGVIINKSNKIDLPHDRWRRHGFFCISVEDTTRALGDLAGYHLKRAGLPVVAITGSNGKTSTRRMTMAVMEQKFSVLGTKGNFNNEIGLPLTLLRCRHDHTLAVLELGMNHFGEIRRLADICKPDIGVITNVGPAHLEGVGSIEGVARAKGELLEHIKPDGTVVLNADDIHLGHLAENCKHKRCFFGFCKTADVGAENVEYGPQYTSFTLRLPHAQKEVTLPAPGRFMVTNALAAAACGYLMGLTLKQIVAGLESYRSQKGRLDISVTAIGIHLIDDTYNANPASMKAALELLAQVKGSSRGIFVCGDMFELGEKAEGLHHDLGLTAAKTGVDRLYATGQYASVIAKGAQKEGLNTERILIGTKAEITSALATQLQTDDWVLVKGSRAMAMETVSEAIKNISNSNSKC